MLYTLHHSAKYHSLPLLPVLLGADHPQEPVLRSEGLPFYQWFYCVKGRGEFIVDHKKAVISEGQGLFIAPYIPHSYKGMNADWTVHLIGFRGAACAEILQALRMTESGVYHFLDSDVFPSYIAQFLALAEGSDPRKEEALSKLCYNMLLDLAPCIQYIHHSCPVAENELIERLIGLMEKNYGRSLSLTELAEQVNLSREYMCTLFKRSMNQTIMQYLQAVRIARARVFLIQYPEKHAAEIAHMCGFESPSYFGKVFKKIVGCTPDNFRRSVT